MASTKNPITEEKLQKLKHRSDGDRLSLIYEWVKTGHLSKQEFFSAITLIQLLKEKPDHREVKDHEFKVGDVLQDMSHETERVLVLVESIEKNRIETRRFEYGKFWGGCAVWTESSFNSRPWRKIPPSRIPKGMKNVARKSHRES